MRCAWLKVRAKIQYTSTNMVVERASFVPQMEGGLVGGREDDFQTRVSKDSVSLNFLAMTHEDHSHMSNYVEVL